MKIKVLAVCFIFLGGFGCATFKGESEFKIRPFDEVRLANGLRVLYIQDESLPYFSINLLIEGGSSLDTKEQNGLANLVAELLRKGTKDKSAINLADELDFIGADFSAGVASDYTQISASSLSFHQEKLVELFVEIVTQPAFQASEVKRLKKNILARLKKVVDNPRGFANRAMMKHLYEDHPYSRSVLGSRQGVKSIRQKHINKFFLKTYRPNKSILAVVGKQNPDIRKKIESAFSSWTERTGKTVDLGEFPKFSGRKILFVDKPGSVQAQVRIGKAGVKRKNSDYLAIRLANTILGGGFASRLNDRIRDDLGLTYGVGSLVDARRAQGPILISTFTRNSKVREIIDESISILEKFYEEGVTEKEVEQAKGLMKGKFPRSIETAERLTFNLMYLRFHGISDDYLSDFIQNVEALDEAEINRIIKKYFNPQDLKILVFGDKKTVVKQLQGIGSLESVGFAELQ